MWPKVMHSHGPPPASRLLRQTVSNLRPYMEALQGIPKNIPGVFSEWATDSGRYIVYNKQKPRDMYNFDIQKFLKEAASGKPGDTSQMQRDKEPGPANHPNTEKEQAEMNKAGNEDMENNKDLDIKKAKPGTPNTDTPDLSSSDLAIKNDGGEAEPVDTGFFATMRAEAKAYIIKKGEAKMSAMMNPGQDNQAEGGKEANMAADEAPKENRPGVDNPKRPTRNDPKGNVPKTPNAPTNNAPPAPPTPVANLPKPNVPAFKFKPPNMPNFRLR